ncbi:MAG: type I-E CRISPR-associated endonuclease Cas1e [Actinomycetaceae bacterium]|nr:type I-E CRISPR-associated endonuclease Cas1e [Actinomycetaceae bacterium]
MAYSAEALAFAKVPVSEQVRLEDRVSYAYIEYARIVQDRTGVVALGTEDGNLFRKTVQLPVGGMAVLMLGPGTSISAAAMTSCTRAGATVIFCGGGGVPAYSHATPLSSSAKWAIAQAKVVSDPALQLAVAKKLYVKQFGIPELGGATIRQLRGIEGQLMKRTYKELAQKYRVKGFRRDTDAQDAVNVALNVCNSLIYGCAASVCAALGLNPALGVIHRGNVRALLFDLGDLYKPSVVLPAAFSCYLVQGEGDNFDSAKVASAARHKMRRELFRHGILPEMLAVTMGLFAPYLPSRDDDRIVDDEGEVPGHVQYGG